MKVSFRDNLQSLLNHKQESDTLGVQIFGKIFDRIGRVKYD